MMGIIYTFLSYRTLSREEWLLKSEYSSLDTLSHSWLKWILTLQFGIWGIAIFTYMIAGSGIPLGKHIDTIIFTTASIWVYTIIILRIRQPQIFINKHVEYITNTLIEKEHSNCSTPDNPQMELLHKKLLSVMVNKEPFLQPRLSLDDLAKELSCSKHDLSFVINQKCRCNFYEFINSYRLNRAKELLDQQTSTFTIYQIALECGFNSKSSFNTLFKRREKRTPSQYRKRALHND